MMDYKIAVIGLGYVGLPVAVAFSKNNKVIGFDKSASRISDLKKGIDSNNESNKCDLISPNLIFTNETAALKDCNFYIVSVPTPIDAANIPDLTMLKKATESVALYLGAGDVVVYESTVYPGVTEDVCVPILESISGLKAGVEFKYGYSPERINPGDSERSFTKILKIVSGCDDEALNIIASVYESVVHAGVYRAESVKVAEAAKVIENTQRDINIALMNELSRIFTRMNIDTYSVLKAAGTKWNFLKFKPGLVGGHCIGVDPYYLTYCARKIGYHPEVILSGRRTNDTMGRVIAEQALLKLVELRGSLTKPRVRILGVTFKENCNDIRNSKVFDIINRFNEFGCEVVAEDPLANSSEVLKHYGIQLTNCLNVNLPQTAGVVTDESVRMIDPQTGLADIVVVAVSHKQYCEYSADDISSILDDNGLLVDVKGIFEKGDLEQANISSWRL